VGGCRRVRSRAAADEKQDGQNRDGDADHPEKDPADFSRTTSSGMDSWRVTAFHRVVGRIAGCMPFDAFHRKVRFFGLSTNRADEVADILQVRSRADCNPRLKAPRNGQLSDKEIKLFICFVLGNEDSCG
jgi:hypothetical protein